jgi:ABC-type multidrug transport system fused ATPase/permease subunit
MKILLRTISEIGPLWRVWLPLSVVTMAMPLAILAMPVLEMRLLDEVVIPGRLDALPGLIATYGVLWLGVGVGQNLSAVWRAYLGERTTQLLYQRLFDHCSELSVGFARREHTARTMSLFTNDIPLLSGFLHSTVILGFAAVVSLVGGIVLMLSLNWQLAVATGLAPLLVAGGAWLVTRPLRPAARRAQEKAAELNERLHEYLVGIREIVAFGREGTQRERFAGTLQELLRLRMKVTAINGAVQTGQGFFSLAVTVVILGYGSLLVIQGDTTIGTLVAMRTLFSYVFQPIALVIGSIGGAQQALGAADRLYAVLDQQPDVKDLGTTALSSTTRGALELDGVTYGYLPDQTVLHDVSFTAQPGEMIAIVGPSGAGKTTLVGAIARFFDPDAGRILLDGTDLRAFPLADLRARIGMVFQDTFLFADTIRANVAFGCAVADEDALVGAMRAANAWEIVERLPDGLDTQIGERGVRLSEGQKQRLAIARAILRRPRILILDEPTSALDARSEHLLQSALENLMRGRTTLVIAHRLATVRRADRILVLDRGRIVEAGTHDDLFRRGGLYRELFDLQFGGGVLPSSASADGPTPSIVLSGA